MKTKTTTQQLEIVNEMEHVILRTLCRTYLTLLTKLAYGHNSTVNSVRISLDETLGADLRNSISEATGLNDELVQTTFEAYAFELQQYPYGR